MDASVANYGQCARSGRRLAAGADPSEDCGAAAAREPREIGEIRRTRRVVKGTSRRDKGKGKGVVVGPGARTECVGFVRRAGRVGA